MGNAIAIHSSESPRGGHPHPCHAVHIHQKGHTYAAYLPRILDHSYVCRHSSLRDHHSWPHFPGNRVILRDPKTGLHRWITVLETMQVVFDWCIYCEVKDKECE